MRHTILAVAVLSLLGAATARALPEPPTIESLVGERLEFRVRWGVIPAATATLEVLDGGAGRIRLRAKARTLPYIDAIYPVRDQIESLLSGPGFTLLRYAKKAKEGWRNRRESEVLFDPSTGSARYFKDGDLEKSLLVPPGVQDPLSCFYRYRTLAVPDDAPVLLDITDGKKLVTGTTTVLGRETVETPAGTFRTVRIEPRIEGIGGIFKKSPGARIFIWLTDDLWRRPVKMESEVVVGSFTAELVRIDPPVRSLPNP